MRLLKHRRIQLMHRMRKGQCELWRLRVRVERRPEYGTQYSEHEGSAAHAIGMCAAGLHHNLADDQPCWPDPLAGIGGATIFHS
jgi:hypothetical protein